MSREYAKKFNEVLLLRAKNRVEDFHKPTGITKLLERNEGLSRTGFNKLFKEHVAEGIKSRNIRGLFRIPDDDKHLVANAQEEQGEKKEQDMQIPLNNDDMQIPHSRPMMYYPSHRPNVPRREVQVEDEEEKVINVVEPDIGEEHEPILRSGEAKRRIAKLPLIGAPGIEPVPEFEDQIYKYETKPRNINEYIKLAKNNPNNVIAVMNPLTHEPQFVIKNKGEITKLYHEKGMTKYYKYYPKDVQQIAAKSLGIKGKIATDLYGKWKEDKLDQIRLQEYPIKYDINKLPHDVVVVSHSKHDDDDNDDDQDRGGQRIRNSDDFMRVVGEAMMKEEEEEEEQEDVQDMSLHKDRRGDDDDEPGNDEFFSPAQSERSERYKEKIDYLKEVNRGLRKDLDEFIQTYPDLSKRADEIEQRNQKLEFNLKQLEEENNYLKDVEETAKRDFNALKSEYNQKIEELRRTSSNNRQLQEQIDDLKMDHNSEIDRIKSFYQGI